MYDELYEIWRRELGSVELEKLPPNFYSKIADYLKNLREEGRMLDKRTMKAHLLKQEMRNVKRMTRQLIQTRYGKVVKKLAKGEKIPSDLLTAEEEKIYKGILPITETYQNFAEGLLRGRMVKVDVQQKHSRAVLCFLKYVPAIIGADMKTYGPFEVEDVASLPVENAKILIKQGLARRVEV